jgi:hypothetical protein
MGEGYGVVGSCQDRAVLRGSEIRGREATLDSQGHRVFLNTLHYAYKKNVGMEEMLSRKKGRPADGRERVDLSVTTYGFLTRKLRDPRVGGFAGFLPWLLSRRGRDRRSSRWKCRNGIRTGKHQ